MASVNLGNSMGMTRVDKIIAGITYKNIEEIIKELESLKNNLKLFSFFNK